MVLSNGGKRKGHLTIDELFKRPPPQKRPSNEDEDLQLAMEMSQREHINEQKRLLEQYSLLSQKQFRPSTTLMPSKKRRLIKVDPEEEEEEVEEEEGIENFTDDDDDQWFQTVSIRSQQPPVKKTPPKPKPKPNPKLKQKETPKQKSKRHIPPTSPTYTSARASTSTSTFSKHNDTNNNDNNTPIVKREDGNGPLLEIDDLDEWLDAKTEKTEASDPALEITDLDAYLDNYQDDDDNEDMEQEPKSVIMIDDLEDQDDIPTPPPAPQPRTSSSRYVPCPMCQKLFKQGREIQEHAAQCNNMISDTADSDSDCDIIDLINPANTMISKQTSPPPPPSLAAEASSTSQAPIMEGEEDDDGYLSPLEGFTSIANNQNEAFNPYFQQLQQPAPKARKARTTTTTRKSTPKRGNGRKWRPPYRRKKKS